MSYIKEYAVEAAKKYAVNSMSENYNHGIGNNGSRLEHNNPYGTMSDSSYERRVIEKPVVYERVESEEIVRPAHHHHEQYYEPAERRVEYERSSEYDRDGRSVYENEGRYANHGRVYDGY